MIICEHFVYAHKHGLIKSPNVEQILTKKSLQHLINLTGNSIIQTWLPEGIVAITYLQHSQDMYGRKTLWNHTILVSPQDYFSLNPPSVFEPYFIKRLGKRTKSLEALRVETK